MISVLLSIFFPQADFRLIYDGHKNAKGNLQGFKKKKNKLCLHLLVFTTECEFLTVL